MRHAAFSPSYNPYKPGKILREIETLVHEHSRMVQRLAWHVHSRMSSAIEVEDLIQIGMIALVEACRTFEDRGTPFVPYAMTRIRGAMIDELRRHARIGRMGMQNRRKLAKVRHELEGQLGRAVSHVEMMTALELTREAYDALVLSAQEARHESIDAEYSDHSMWFADLTNGVDTSMEIDELHSLLRANISQLGEREAMVLQLYFVEEMNLEEIGQVFGIGSARVCQIKKVALEKLRKMMNQS